MKLVTAIIFFLINFFEADAQKITYSVVHSNEGSATTDFDILGKVGPNYLVFKDIGWRSILQVFDKDMNELSNERLKFMPDKVVNVDFITYPDHFLMIYQFQRNNILYCNVVKMDGHGKKLETEYTLDTVRIGSKSPNGVYNCIYSEDKKRILIYKMQEKDNKLYLATKLYVANLQMLDSTRFVFDYNDRKEIYSPFQLANDGSFCFTKEIKTGARENFSRIEVVEYRPNNTDFTTIPIDLQKNYIDDINVKIDNLNNNYLINAFYYPEKKSSSIAGLFSAVISRSTGGVRTYINTFSDSLRSVMTGTNQFRFAFDNLFLQNIFLKRDGSFILVAEDFSTQSIGGYRPWNRWDYLYNNPYSYYDYNYMYSPYYRYDRFNTFNNSSTRFYYDKALVLSVDNNLKLNWNNIILKSQVADDDDSYLSFGTMNAGAQIHFLYIEKDRNAQLVQNHSISPYGNFYRYPTIKAGEAGYNFMPRLLKQVGAKTIIMPCVHRGNLAFAKIDF